MEIRDMAREIEGLGRGLRARGLMLAGAESCTGGLISSMLTDVSGSSDWFAGTVVSYANSAKLGLLGVPGDALERHGAVSRQVVEAMAAGARAALGADASFAVSGIAGPTGGTPDKPVGTVWMAWSLGSRAKSEKFLFKGDRAEVKRRTAEAAILGMAAMLAEEGG